MATFTTTRKTNPTKWADGFVWQNELNVRAQDLVKTAYEGFNLIEYYTEKQKKFFNGTATFVWSKCHISANDCKSIIEQLLPTVEHYAIITHDKDKATPHTHLLIKFSRVERIASRLVEYFHIDSWEDCFHKLKNVFAYLIHDSDKCRKEGKYQYSKDEIVTDDLAWWEQFVTDQEVSENGSKSMIDDLLKGLSNYEMLEKYGDSFTYHRKQLFELLYAIREERAVLNRDLYEIHSLSEEWLAIYDKRTGSLVNIRPTLAKAREDMEIATDERELAYLCRNGGRL